jgi:hypothetical protein
MTVDRLAGIILDLDPDAAISANGIELSIDDIPVLVVVTPVADRMRAMVPIAGFEDVSAQEMERMMQANSTPPSTRDMLSHKTVFGACLSIRSPHSKVNSFCPRWRRR